MGPQRRLGQIVGIALCAATLACVHHREQARALHSPGVAYYYATISASWMCDPGLPIQTPCVSVSEEEARNSTDGYFVAYFDSSSRLERYAGYRSGKCYWRTRFYYRYHGADKKLDSVVNVVDSAYVHHGRGSVQVLLFGPDGHYTHYFSRPRVAADSVHTTIHP
jgi:hypothetical protein